MVDIQITTKHINGRRYISSIMVQGHADAAPPGQDLICCAISTLMQSAILVMQSYEIEADCEIKKHERTVIKFLNPDGKYEQYTAMWIKLTAEQLSTQYPEFIKVTKNVPTDLVSLEI